MSILEVIFGESPGDAIAIGLDRLTEGRRGRIVTTAIKVGGYAEDDEALEAYYLAHRDAVEGYCDLIDVPAMLMDAQQQAQMQSHDPLTWARANAAPLAVGFGAGATLCWLLS